MSTTKKSKPERSGQNLAQPTHTYCYNSPLGDFVLENEGEVLVRAYFPSDLSSEPIVKVRSSAVPSVFSASVRWLDAYFRGQELPPLPPFRLYGTDFQKRVWQQLLTISYGTTTTYGHLSQRLGISSANAAPSAQAVGAALSRNPILIFLPCHRVLGSKGQLIGFAAGIDRKEALLRHEGYEF